MFISIEITPQQQQQKIAFPDGTAVKNPSANTGDSGDTGMIPGLGRSPGVGNGNRLWYSCLENFMDRGGWWVTVHGVAKSQTRLSDFTFIFYTSEEGISNAKIAEKVCLY